MSENRMLKISYKELGYPLEMFIAVPLYARADEYTALFNILRHYGKSVGIDLTVAGAEKLRPAVAALGITDVMWEFHIGRPGA
jgi:hypothetical protein